jgi:hypothetical protein
VPKTLIYAVDDNHAQEIVDMVREVFGQGNEFRQKITYSAKNPDKLLAAFRNSPELRVAVTVDMIATGTDVRPLECVFFLRDVKSWAYFEQMKGRGARTVSPDEIRAVTPDVVSKDRFVIVDAVGVTDSPRVDASPLERHTEKQISLKNRRPPALPGLAANARSWNGPWSRSPTTRSCAAGCWKSAARTTSMFIAASRAVPSTSSIPPIAPVASRSRCSGVSASPHRGSYDPDRFLPVVRRQLVLERGREFLKRALRRAPFVLDNR